MPPRVSTRDVLLKELLAGDGSGMALAERIEKASSGRVCLHQGKLYPALRELERDGFLESRGVGRYGLTPRGRQVAEQR